MQVQGLIVREIFTSPEHVGHGRFIYSYGDDYSWIARRKSQLQINNLSNKIKFKMNLEHCYYEKQ